MQYQEPDVASSTPSSTVYESGNSDRPGTGKAVAQGAADAAGSAAGDVAHTAKEEAKGVAREASGQARNVAHDVRQRMSQEARTQNDRAADTLRRLADEFDEMARARGDSPAQAVVSRLATGGRQAADYLAKRGPEGILDELQDFARRRPGAFLATAAVAGFVAGRLGKGVLAASGGRGTDSGPVRATVPMPETTRPGTGTSESGYTTSESGYATSQPGYTATGATGTGPAPEPSTAAYPPPPATPPSTDPDVQVRGGPR